MSSVVHSPHPQQSSKQQWWSRPTASKSSTIPTYRSADSPRASTPTASTSRLTQFHDEKTQRGSKQSKKFNTLASVIGFKSRKTHPTISIPAGPASPPLPVQYPPSSIGPTPRDPVVRTPYSGRPVTASSGSSYQYDPKSPGEPSIYTYPSSEEAQEPMTPSDQLSRHRTSYQPSLFTFAEQQDYSAAALRLGDGLGTGSRYYSSSDARRVSIMSDPSVVDPHMRKEQAIRSSRISASSYYPAPSEQKNFPGRLSNGFLGHRDSLERRKSSGESRVSKEIDLTEDRNINTGGIKAFELRPRDHRHSDLGVPAVPEVSASLFAPGQKPTLHKSTSEIVVAAKSSGSRSGSRTASPVSTSGRSFVREEERFGASRNSSTNGFSPSGSARLSSPMLRPKAASVSAGSLSGSSAGGRPSPSFVTSFASATPLSRNPSVTSGAGSAVVGSIVSAVGRKQSINRMRAVPPSRNPPPKSNLPPTPQGRTPSPVTFRSPRNASSTSLLNSTNSTSDDPSILKFDLPPETPSSETSSVSLCFAPAGEASLFSDLEPSPVSMSSMLIPKTHRDIRSTNSGRLVRQDFPSQRGTMSPTHTIKSSLSSNHTLMTALGSRGDTPVQRSIRKSMSQSSITFDKGGRGERQRVDSDASITSSNLISEENSASMFNHMRSLRKQRSLHNTRAPVGSLALPPLPQQLRHASSFNTASVSDGSGRANLSHTKGDSIPSPFGSQRRSAHSSTPASVATSLVSTPTTPQTHKKRSIFSSHGRDRERREASASYEREKQEFATGSQPSPDAHHGDRKRTHGIGLGLFGAHFSPSSSSSQIPDVPGNVNAYTRDSRRESTPPAEASNFYRPHSPPSINNANTSPSGQLDQLDQHILPPKELLSQMEALADTEAPSSPLQFSDRGLEDEDDDGCWDTSSFMMSDNQSMRSRLTSLSGLSVTSGVNENGIVPKEDLVLPPSSTATRRFANASGSIHGRLQNERPSSSSRLPMRNVSNASGISRVSTSSATRPLTADPLYSVRRTSTYGYCAPTPLPPPPRRKGAAISNPATDQFVSEEPEINPLPPPPPRNPPSRPQRLPSLESQGQSQSQGLQRLPSHESMSTYNPNRGLIFRRPSFLNIDDEHGEQGGNVVKKMMSTVPEDSFLILEHGKDSLDLTRRSNEP